MSLSLDLLRALTSPATINELQSYLEAIILFLPFDYY